MAHDKLDRVRKLLAKAERAATPEEAEAFTAKATDLMTRYAIDEAMLGVRQESTDTLGQRTKTFQGAYAKVQVQFLNSVATAMGCKVVYAPGGRGGSGTTRAYVYGWESDLAMLDVLHASLVLQGTAEEQRQWDTTRRPVHGGVNRRSFRTSFWVGFGHVINTRLEAQRNQLVRETEDERPGTAVALYDRKQAVNRHVQQQHPRLRSGQGSSTSSHQGYYGGRAAGERADLGTGSRLGATGHRALSA